MFMNFVVTLADKVDTLAESVKSLQAQTEKNSLLFAKLVKRSQFDYDFLNLTGEKVAEAYMKALEHQPSLFLESCRSTTMTELKKLAEVVKLSISRKLGTKRDWMRLLKQTIAFNIG